MSTKICLLALAAFHSFTFAAADVSTITAAPSPTPVLDERGDVAGGPGTPILSTLSYAYTALPYQVYPFQVLRGPQSGYNICNDTTAGPDSQCQTLIVNSVSDFCIWGSPTTTPTGQIGDVEAAVVAYCTNPNHGTRVIPAGSITGLQFMKTSAYIQWTGFISNEALNLMANDTGGELDPHGADLQGNPLGAMVFSNGTTDSVGGVETQVMNWNEFVGNGQFCFKACYNSITSPDYCQNTYDLVGCEYNMPSNVQVGEFLECEGDLQDPMGIYTGSNGQTSTWSMPNPLTTDPPYTPRVPASSNCITHQSSDLFAAVTSSLTGVSSSGTATTTSSGTLATTGGSSSSGSGSSGSASTTKTSTSAAATSSNGALSMKPSTAMGLLAGVVGMFFAL